MMSILKAESTKEPLKFMGLFLPPWVQQYLLMYTLAKGVTKSAVVRKLIEDWVAQKQSTSPAEYLLQDIIHKVKLQWELEKSLKPAADLSFYKKNLEKELKSKGLAEADITMILIDIN